MHYIEHLNIFISEEHYEIIYSGKSFTLFIDGDIYHLIDGKFSNNCQLKNYIVTDYYNTKTIKSFENFYLKESWLNGYVYLNNVNLLNSYITSSGEQYYGTFSSYVQPDIWNLINKDIYKNNPLAWRNSLKFDSSGYVVGFTSKNKFYTKHGKYNKQRTNIANNWYIFNDAAKTKLKPTISLQKVLDFMQDLFSIKNGNNPIFSNYYESKQPYPVFNLQQFWNDKIKSNELASPSAKVFQLTDDNQILITYPSGEAHCNSTIFLPCNISITGQGNGLNKRTNTIIYVSGTPTHIRCLDGNNAISNISVLFSNYENSAWTQSDGDNIDVGTNGPGAFVLGGWCKTIYASGGNVGCRTFKTVDRGPTCKNINTNDPCLDSKLNDQAKSAWNSSAYLSTNARFNHGTTNIVLDNIDISGSGMFFFSRQSPENTPHTFIKITYLIKLNLSNKINYE